MSVRLCPQQPDIPIRGGETCSVPFLQERRKSPLAKRQKYLPLCCNSGSSGLVWPYLTFDPSHKSIIEMSYLETPLHLPSPCTLHGQDGFKILVNLLGAKSKGSEETGQRRLLGRSLLLSSWGQSRKGRKENRSLPCKGWLEGWGSAFVNGIKTLPPLLPARLLAVREI